MNWVNLNPLISEEELRIATEWKEGGLFGFFCDSFDNHKSSTHLTYKRKYFDGVMDQSNMEGFSGLHSQDGLRLSDLSGLHDDGPSGNYLNQSLTKKSESSSESTLYPPHGANDDKIAMKNVCYLKDLHSHDFCALDNTIRCNIGGTRKIFVPPPLDMELLKKDWYSIFLDINIKDCIWNTNFDATMLYGREKGHCNLPRTLECRMPSGAIVKLGLWLSNQRARKKVFKLRQDRLVRMENIVAEGKLDWYLDRKEINSDNQKWEFMYNNLVEYGRLNRHCDIPQKFTIQLETNDELRLGEWLTRQRFLMKSNILLIERMERLQVLVDKGWFHWDTSFAL